MTSVFPGVGIGQGDTVLLGFPLQFNASHRVWRGNKPATRLNDIRYYSERVDPKGSFMTAGHFVIAWMEKEHRNQTAAAEWFARSRSLNTAPWRLWLEHDWNDGGAVNFITAGGMFLQGLLFGYGGLRFGDSGVTFDPQLPPGVTAMKLRGLGSRDAEFDLMIEGAEDGTVASTVSFWRHHKAGDGGDGAGSGAVALTEEGAESFRLE